ncbi:sigma-70 family RNA polymerase sigma factor [Bacillus alkalisoli]|uniref:sigma-70 family RNA polymerase sigma factor n=1 Tax=Bacillus alkalisoli TaxID=2011008 RepID=UPI000C23BB3B|nr:sigma-70 family RNA polymerase sigma factor [Bacillus alkalisoli]
MGIKDREFSMIVEQYGLVIYKIIQTLHVREEDIEEMYQEGLVALWYAWKGYEESKATFSTYAYWTVRGMLINLIKKDRRFYDTHCSWKPGLEEVIPDHSNKTIHEQLRDLECYIKNLTENQKRWLIEFILKGKKLEEIAEEYGTTVAAVKSWRRSAIKTIKLNLQ